MKAALTAARTGGALIALLALIGSFSATLAAAPARQAPQMILISTDTSDPYPFAAIVVNHTTYHVTEGDILDGVYIRRIAPGRVTLSNDEVLVAVRQPAPDPATYQVTRANMR